MSDLAGIDFIENSKPKRRERSARATAHISSNYFFMAGVLERCICLARYSTQSPPLDGAISARTYLPKEQIKRRAEQHTEWRYGLATDIWCATTVVLCAV